MEGSRDCSQYVILALEATNKCRHRQRRTEYNRPLGSWN